MAMWIPERAVRGGMIPGHWQEAGKSTPAKKTERRWVEPQAARGGWIPGHWQDSTTGTLEPWGPPSGPAGPMGPSATVDFPRVGPYGPPTSLPLSSTQHETMGPSAPPQWQGGGSWVRPQAQGPVAGFSGGAASTRTRDAVRSVPVMRPPGQVAPSHPTSQSSSPRNWDGGGAATGQDPMLLGGAYPTQPRPRQDPMLLGDTSQHYAAMADMGIHPDAPSHPQAAQAVLSQLGLGEEANQAYWNAARELILKSPQVAAGHMYDTPDPRYGFGPYFSAQTFEANGSPAGPASPPGRQNSAAYAAWLALKNANQAQLSSPEWRETLAAITAESYYAPEGPGKAAYQPNAWRDFLPAVAPPPPPPGPYQGAMNAYAAQMPQAFAF